MKLTLGGVLGRIKRQILGDDRPKQNPWQHDRLGFAPTAERLAKTVIETISPNGYVIGLHGKWGSGKSTMLNFVLAYVDKHNVENEDDKLIHIDFRPWLISGHQDLIVGFFKILTEKLAQSDPAWKRNRRKLAKAIDGAAGDIVDAAAKVALTLDPTGGMAAGIAGKLAKGGIHTLLKPFIEEPSLQAAYENLKGHLSKSGMRFLVTIDDIDRLNEDEVKSIMHMVKSVGQLPNVIYLLSYDRDIVWAALDKGVNRQGPKVGEKIVQQEIEIPRLQRSHLLTILDEETSFLIGDTPNDSRWQDIVADGIHRWIRTPRDVVRLSNAVKFVAPSLKGEVDAQDILAMEGLKLFDQGAFNWIRDNRDFLFSEGIYQIDNKEAADATVAQLKNRLDSEGADRVINLLCALFPQTRKRLMGKDSFYSTSFEEVVRRRGVGSPIGYDAYFAMMLPRGAVPRAVVESLLADGADIEFIRAAFNRAMTTRDSQGQLQIVGLIDELRIRFRGGNAVRPSPALFNVLFEFGEQVIGYDIDRGAFSLPPSALLSFMIQNMLESWGIDEAGRQIVSAFSAPTSVAFLAEIYTDLGQSLGVFPSSSNRKALISSEVFEQIGEALIQKLDVSAADGTLRLAPYFFNIIQAWVHLANSQTVKAWIEAGIAESPMFLARLGKGLVGYSIGTPVREYFMRETPDPTLFNLEKLHAAAQNHMVSTEISDDQRNLLKVITESTGEMLKKDASR